MNILTTFGQDPFNSLIGEKPTSIIQKSTDNFDGTAATGTPTIGEGLTYFPGQAGGGLFNFHFDSIDVLRVIYSGGGTCTVKKSSPFGDITVGTIAAAGSLDLGANGLRLGPTEWLKVVSSGATTPVVEVTSRLAPR